MAPNATLEKGSIMVGERKQSTPRAYSRYGREAVSLLGQLIRVNRVERKLSVEELATRTGAWRAVMRRIEAGLGQVDRTSLWGRSFLNPFAFEGLGKVP